MEPILTEQLGYHLASSILVFKKFFIDSPKRHTMNWLVLHDPQPLMIVLEKNASKFDFVLSVFSKFSSAYINSIFDDFFHFFDLWAQILRIQDREMKILM